MKMLKRLLLLFISFIFFSLILIVCIELYLRFTLQPYPPVTQINKELGYTAPPNLKGTYKILDNSNNWRRIKYQINSLGFRDIEHQFKKPDNTKRILIFGDSFLAGFQVEFSKLTCRKVSEFLLNRDSKNKYEVFNFANIGYQPSAELLVLKNLALKYKPDYVIICFFQNDPTDMSEILDNGASLKRTVHHVLTENNSLILKYPQKKDTSLRKRFNIFLSKSTYFYRWQKDKIQNIKRNFEKKYSIYYKMPNYYKLYFKKLPEEFERCWELTFKIYNEFNNLSQKHNFNLIIVNLPSLENIDDKKIKSYLQNFEKWKDTELELQNSHNRLERFCREKGIDYIYPDKIYKENLKYEPYFINDGHFTNLGHKLLSEVIGKYIIKKEKEDK